MPGRLDFEVLFGQPQPSPRREQGDGDLARLLVLGDFSGQETTERLRTVKVDVDNFDDIFASFSPQVRLPQVLGESDDAVLHFGELDDFHPDALYPKLPVFKSLRELRKKLMDPATFAEAAAQLRTAAQTQAADQGTVDATSSVPADDAPGEPEDDQQTFQRLLGGDATASRARPPSHRQIDNLIESVVAPFIVPDADPLQSVYVDSVDEAVTAKMRDILHAPRFQAMEATWRGIYRLVTGVETSETLELHLLDVSRDQLLADLTNEGTSVTESSLYRLLVEGGRQTTGGQGWSAVAANMTFGPGAEDIDLLAALGAVAAHAGGPLLAAASSAMLGCDRLDTDPRQWSPLGEDEQKRWDALRASSLAPWIGLAVPRILSRLPYGAQGEEIDAFAFEELTDPPEHESLLWESPAIACLLLLAQSAVRSGWPPEPLAAVDLEDLPAFTYRAEDEVRLYPCGEVCLIERAIEEVLRRGLMPLASFKNRNAVRLVRSQSIADPPAAVRFS
jgi:type VI secretion system protein ImpC